MAGFPNGRRVFDDVVSIELRAIAGVTFKLIDPHYTVDAAAGQLTDGLTPADLGTPFLSHDSTPWRSASRPRSARPPAFGYRLRSARTAATASTTPGSGAYGFSLLDSLKPSAGAGRPCL